MPGGATIFFPLTSASLSTANLFFICRSNNFHYLQAMVIFNSVAITILAERYSSYLRSCTHRLLKFFGLICFSLNTTYKGVFNLVDEVVWSHLFFGVYCLGNLGTLCQQMGDLMQTCHPHTLLFLFVLHLSELSLIL